MVSGFSCRIPRIPLRASVVHLDLREPPGSAHQALTLLLGVRSHLLIPAVFCLPELSFLTYKIGEIKPACGLLQGFREMWVKLLAHRKPSVRWRYGCCFMWLITAQDSPSKSFLGQRNVLNALCASEPEELGAVFQLKV